MVDINLFFSRYAENNKKYGKKYTFISPKKHTDFITIFEGLNVKKFLKYVILLN